MKKLGMLVLVCLLATATTGCKVKIKRGRGRNNGNNQGAANAQPLAPGATDPGQAARAPLATPITTGLPAAPTAAT